jgi:hypothetical protein
MDLSYTLLIDEDEQGRPQYEIVEGTREHGDDTVVCTPDTDEAACWITDLLDSKDA